MPDVSLASAQAAPQSCGLCGFAGRRAEGLSTETGEEWQVGTVGEPADGAGRVAIEARTHGLKPERFSLGDQ